ncbi:unnamed protein product [Mycena citricolor]|uniref:Uncharacterized protein n=1 Tax=Mycena citricolor TaxID=2018698 RepID=A0AAD2JVE2_9AGAR|nr:unnamed protein product [Mycena citricolor]
MRSPTLDSLLPITNVGWNGIEIQDSESPSSSLFRTSFSDGRKWTALEPAPEERTPADPRSPIISEATECSANAPTLELLTEENLRQLDHSTALALDLFRFQNSKHEACLYDDHELDLLSQLQHHHAPEYSLSSGNSCLFDPFNADAGEPFLDDDSEISPVIFHTDTLDRPVYDPIPLPPDYTYQPRPRSCVRTRNRTLTRHVSAHIMSPVFEDWESTGTTPFGRHGWDPLESFEIAFGYRMPVVGPCIGREENFRGDMYYAGIQGVAMEESYGYEDLDQDAFVIYETGRN